MRAELFAIYFGLYLAWERRYENVVIELDSLLVDNKIASPLQPNDHLFQVIRACQEFLKRNWRCQIVRTFREANRCGNYLASWAFRSGFDVSQLDDPPGQLHRLIQEDLPLRYWVLPLRKTYHKKRKKEGIGSYH